jgi:hypothetical protein
MVWCARESADYERSAALCCHWHYGWIHWDAETRSWHSVTNRQLSLPQPTALPEIAGVQEHALPHAQAAGHGIRTINFEVSLPLLYRSRPGGIPHADDLQGGGQP